MKDSIENDRFESTGFCYTMSLMNGKYKMIILYTLMRYEAVRYNALKRYIDSISFKTLSIALKELENDGLIVRTEYQQIPPKVEYRLSKMGESLVGILDAMCKWGEIQKAE